MGPGCCRAPYSRGGSLEVEVCRQGHGAVSTAEYMRVQEVRVRDYRIARIRLPSSYSSSGECRRRASSAEGVVSLVENIVGIRPDLQAHPFADANALEG